MSRTNKAVLILGMLGVVAATHAHATNDEFLDTIPAPNERYRSAVGPAAHGEKLEFGDSWSADAGAVSFTQTDVSIPGNFALPVAITRTRSRGQVARSRGYGFGDWQMSLPRVEYEYRGASRDAWEVKRCSGDIPDFVPSKTGRGPFYTNNVFNNFQLYGFGGGGQPLLKPGSGFPGSALTRPDLTTASFWRVDCIPTADGRAEGFLATDLNGTRYWFDIEKRRRSGRTTPSYDGYLVQLLPSKIEDVHGNTVSYTYGPHGVRTITASDGRTLTLSYNGAGKVGTVVVNGRTWTYGYASNRLTSVKRPDGRSWTFAGLAALEAGIQNRGDTTICHVTEVAQYRNNLTGSLTVTNPYGATLKLDLGTVRNGRVGFDPVSPEGTVNFARPCWEYASVGKYFTASLGLKAKTITVPGEDPYVWSYVYEQDSGARWGSSSISSTKTRTIKQPDGSRVEQDVWRAFVQHGADEGPIEGSVTERRVYSSHTGGSLLEKTTTTYARTALAGRLVRARPTPGSGTPFLTTGSERQVLPKTVRISRGGDWFETTTSYNAFGISVLSEEFSNTSGVDNGRATARYVQTNTADWVIGPVTSLVRGKASDCAMGSYGVPSCSNVKELFGYQRWPSGLPKTRREFGEDVASYTFHSTIGAKGSLASVTQNVSAGVTRTTEFRRWHRGTPQEIERADGVVLTSIVDDNGWTKSVTSPLGVTTGYDYDDLGRLTLIDAPDRWADTSVVYQARWNGALKQVVTLGAKVVVTEYDGLLRAEKTLQRANWKGGDRVTTETTYDAFGRVTYTTGPYSDRTSASPMRTTYDGLGRPLTVTTVNGTNLTTTYKYLRGAFIRVLDPEGHWTDTHLYGWGNPNDLLPKRILQYDVGDGLLSQTDHWYDVWGNLSFAQQGGNANGYNTWKRKKYHYDEKLRLCRQYTPETGSTLFRYNLAGEVERRASGQHGWTADCGTLPPEDTITNHYDELGRLDLVTYGDGTSYPTDYEYDHNGNLTSLERGGLHWLYEYAYAGETDLIERETLYVDPHYDASGDITSAAREFDIQYGYDSDGGRRWTQYPTGLRVDFEPNAYGQPRNLTQTGGTAQSFATTFRFHANGALASVDYANGAQLSVTMSDRQLPERRFVGLRDGSNLFDLNYDYDGNRRITSIADAVGSDHDRTYDYDGMGRLVTGRGPWGGIDYVYDAIGNLREKRLGWRELTLSYDWRNRLEWFNGHTMSGYRNQSAMTYDDRGNVLSDGQNTFTYDLADRPVTFSAPGGKGGTMRYDGHGRRVKQTRNHGGAIYSVYSLDGTLVHRDDLKAGETIDYLRAGGTLIAEVEHEVARSGYCPTRKEGGGPCTTTFTDRHTPTYVHADHLGSALAKTDAAGVLVPGSHVVATPYGEIWANNSSTEWDDAAGFTGHVQDADTGLTYMQARYYNPAVGRFYGNDPIPYQGDIPAQFGRYSYAWNDPVNAIDPDGRMPINPRQAATAARVAKTCTSSAQGAMVCGAGGVTTLMIAQGAGPNSMIGQGFRCGGPCPLPTISKTEVVQDPETGEIIGIRLPDGTVVPVQEGTVQPDLEAEEREVAVGKKEGKSKGLVDAIADVLGAIFGRDRADDSENGNEEEDHCLPAAGETC